MCAFVYSSLLLFTLTTVCILPVTRMVTEGLPLVRQERGTEDSDLLAGADFLSVFMDSSFPKIYPETTPTPPEMDFRTRTTRSTSPIAQPNTEESSFYDTTSQLAQKQSSDSSVVVAVSVSSSVGRTLLKKEQDTVRETTTDQDFIASEEQPSLVAEANKSDFSVEESEPITTNSELTGEFSQGYPATVQALPRAFNPPPDFINKNNLHPIQQTVIYHNNPRDSGRARSVSYSTVIQSIPQANVEKQWESEKLERRERHFDSQTTFNNFQNKNKPQLNDTHSLEDIGRSKNWQKSTSEKNWEIPEKPYAPSIPMIYGKPEQNYEVDESASVMTNGRIHGIQSNPTLGSKQDVKIGESKKVDDNQKVGYVVEGRNYRKYRVEERTSDGFIVGEYGVVSHDDGSLRGVRYTADGTISPRLIYDALMKFLSL